MRQDKTGEEREKRRREGRKKWKDVQKEEEESTKVGYGERIRKRDGGKKKKEITKKVLEQGVEKNSTVTAKYSVGVRRSLGELHGQ